MADIQLTKRKFEILTPMLLKVKVFWDVMPCRWTNSCRRLKDVRTFTFSAKQSRTAWPWIWRHYDPSELRELLSQRHSVTPQKTWN